MSVELLQSVLGWCTVVNVAVLILWFGCFVGIHGIMYRAHSRLFRMSAERFDEIHYASLAAYKVAIIVLNLAPYLALNLATRS